MDISPKLIDFWKKHSTYISLAILIIIESLIIYYRVNIQIRARQASDTCDFLSNAFVFAGQYGIYSDILPYFGWYLKTNVQPMPEFKDNKKFYGGITS